MRALAVIVPSLVLVGIGTFGATAQERAGRYTMSPIDGGFVRLDTETGAMSTCNRRDTKWVCEPMGDEGQSMRSELDRLRAENRRLEALAGIPPQSEGLDAPTDKRLELPSEEDVDKAFDYVERLFRKFRDRIKQFEKEDGEGKGTPL